ncbi:MAG TPA: selenoneine biosynthesis selenosugar synthase SenB [Burkholderiales bacterium]|nr:selenoneine biosynthesis selenosugar synthase SenB [Burkholderiales bacterium]
MPLPVVRIVTPYGAAANNGNWRTAARWARLLRGHYRTMVQADTLAGEAPEDSRAVCLIALHARRSYPAIRAWRERYPRRPLIVVLTGTDLYRDLPCDAQAQASLRLADRLVLLQEDALRHLPAQVRRKARVIHQSASTLTPAERPVSRLNCILVGHLRAEKDPGTVLRAWSLLAPELPLHLLHVGGALDAGLAAECEASMARDPRYRWVGARPHAWTRQAIKRAHLLILPSLMEGGANVIVEAVTAGTAVLASRVSGNVGMLGHGYAGYFPAGDAQALARLVQRCWSDAAFHRRLARECRARRALFTPAHERAALLRVLSEMLPDYS